MPFLNFAYARQFGMNGLHNFGFFTQKVRDCVRIEVIPAPFRRCFQFAQRRENKNDRCTGRCATSRNAAETGVRVHAFIVTEPARHLPHPRRGFCFGLFDGAYAGKDSGMVFAVGFADAGKRVAQLAKFSP